MLIEDIINNGGICLNGISNTENQLWQNYVVDLVKKRKLPVFYNYSNGTEKDHFIINNEFTGISIKDANEITINDSISQLFFTDTPQNLIIPDGLPKNTRICSFFGGLKQDEITKQIEKVNSLGISKLITDILPEETDKPFDFTSELYLIQPTIPKNTRNLTTQTNEEILLIHNEHVNINYPESLNQIIYKALDQNNKIRILDLTQIPIEDWFTEGMPGNFCKKICISLDLPQLHHLFADLAFKLGIEFSLFGCTKLTSPNRYFTDGKVNLLNSFKDLFPLRKKSLRENIRNICNQSSNKTNINKSKESHEICQKVSIEKSSVVSSGQLNKSRDEILHIFKPLNYIFKDIPECKIFISNYQYLLGKCIKGELNQFVSAQISLFINATLKRATCLLGDPNDKFAFCSHQLLLRLTDLDFKTVVEQIFILLKDNSYETGILRLAGYFNSILYQNNFTAEDKFFARNKLLQSTCPNEIKFSMRMSLISKELFIEEIKKLWDKQTKGLAGANILNLIIEDINIPKDELLFFKDICQQEISIGLDDFLTHKSYIIIEILLGNSQGSAQILSNCSKYKFKFNYRPIYNFEIAYLCIFKNDNEEAISFINQESEEFSDSGYFKLARYSIQILANKFNENETHFTLEKEENLWSKDNIFFCALNHYIIFTYHEHKNGTKKAFEILKGLNSNFFFLTKLVDKIKGKKEKYNLMNKHDLDYLYKEIDTVSSL
tara:strand:+ start:155 stop:2320 length:2166 start_codon:yes stop_codon:yes gene_type:complete